MAANDYPDDRLCDLLLGLTSDPELAAAVREEPRLRERCRVLKASLRSLDGELEEALKAGDGEPLPSGSWRILLPVNDSLEALHATLAAAALAKRGGGVVEVLHVRVVPTGPLGLYIPETWAEAAALVGRAVGELRYRDVAARGQLRSAGESRVVQSIIDEAEEIRANLIVIGSTTGSWLAALNGSRVAGGVIKKAHCPVLVTP